MRIRTRLSVLLLVLAALCWQSALAYNRNSVATGPDGQPVRIAGSVVVIEPDIELSLLTAGGLQEPRREWTEAARRLYPLAVAQVLAEAQVAQRPDYDIPDDLPATSRLGQIMRLNEAVATSIAVYSTPGSELATKEKQLDWTLGPGVQELATATGADYALFTYLRDSYASGGRKAMRVLGFLAGAAMGGVMDIGGGHQIGVAMLVDLRTGQVVWFNLLSKQTGDLRDADGAGATARELLFGLPL